MANHLLNMVKKELREIFRDPRLFVGMVIVPIMIFPMMGLVMNASMEAAEEEAASMEIGFFSRDGEDGDSSLSDFFYEYMLTMNLDPINATAQDSESAVEWAVDNDVATIIVFPINFTEAIINATPARVKVYQVMNNYGLTESAGTERALFVIRNFNSALTAMRLSGQYPNATTEGLLYPATVESNSVIRGEIVEVSPEDVIITLLSTSIAMPMVIMILIIMAGQLAATTVAMEKEQKTLEVLLSLPIKRINILLGKLAGVILVSIFVTIAYLVGFSYYMQGFSVGSGRSAVDMAAIGLAPEPLGYALMAASLFLSFIAALSLAVLLAAYTKDVRSAQSLMGIVYMPVLIPAMVLMMVPVEILPAALQGMIYAIPFSYSILASKALYTKEYLTIMLGIVYQVVFMVVVLALASRLFASEKVLTARLEFFKKKKPKLE